MPISPFALLLVTLVTVQSAIAQSLLGEVIDAGGKRMSGEQFRNEIVQRSIAGLTPSGGKIEMMYAMNGTIAGVGALSSQPVTSHTMHAQVSGTWAIDDGDRVCTTLKIFDPVGFTAILPARCQAWFKLGDAYFISDSDSDRRMKVLKRTLK
ncbi:MAG TPA: hypothetical protein VNG69_00850 [Casimicrobiaceae bacterium]|nr:hypothetical protein [Casimicrobiaceae bacterium]